MRGESHGIFAVGTHTGPVRHIHEMGNHQLHFKINHRIRLLGKCTERSPIDRSHRSATEDAGLPRHGLDSRRDDIDSLGG